MRLAAATDDPNGLVAFLRERQCIAYAVEDGIIEVIPPAEVDPADDWFVIDLVRGWHEAHGLTLR